MKLTANSTQNRQKTQKAQKDKKTSFPKEFLKCFNKPVDFYKPLWNKIMTTHEKCVKYNFVAPLIIVDNLKFLPVSS